MFGDSIRSSRPDDDFVLYRADKGTEGPTRFGTPGAGLPFDEEAEPRQWSMVLSVPLLLRGHRRERSRRWRQFTRSPMLRPAGTCRWSFEATVTYYRDYERTLFVQDGDTAIYVRATTGLKLMPGDRIRVQRNDARELSAVCPGNSTIERLGHGAMPRAVTGHFDDLIQARYDCRLVTVRATRSHRGCVELRRPQFQPADGHRRGRTSRPPSTPTTPMG